MKEQIIKRLNEFVLNIAGRKFAPLMVGGMGVDVSTPELALSIAELGGIAHLSDAMIQAVVDRHFNTKFVADKRNQFKDFIGRSDKSFIKFNQDDLKASIDKYIRPVMDAKKGMGAIFVNIMEKLTMADPKGTLKARMTAAMDAGIDGITLSAGLHMGSFDLIKDHPRFRKTMLGIIVSSTRALKIFLQRAAKSDRMPDYIVIEGPLAGGHLGFPLNWQDFDLKEIVKEVMSFLDERSLKIPIIPAGGIFTGPEAVEFMEMGASGIQAATRFSITQESGLPDKVKQAFFSSEPEQVVVNMLSPAGYPMRMLKQSPAVSARVRPMCEEYGYALDNDGHCSYNDWYYRDEKHFEDGKTPEERTCLCAMMHGYKVWTCGQNVTRLKETAHRLPSGEYQIPSAKLVFDDYMNGPQEALKE